jgi:hypothetical protein
MGRERSGRGEGQLQALGDESAFGALLGQAAGKRSLQCGNRSLTAIPEARTHFQASGVPPASDRRAPLMTILDPISGDRITIDTTGKPRR